MPVTTAEVGFYFLVTSTYSVGRAGAAAAATFPAFRFRCLRSPRFRTMSPFVLFLVPFSLCSAPLAFVEGAGTFLFVRGAGEAEPPVASGSIFPVPTSFLSTFLVWWVVWGCILEST